MGFVTLGFGVCAGRGSVGCVWSAVVMGVTGAVAVFLRYFEARVPPDVEGHTNDKKPPHPPQQREG